MQQKIKLDAKNLQLLNELEKDSRKPISQIAKAIKTSKEVAHYRLKKLINSGFIIRFASVIDYFLLDYDSYRLLINLHNINYGIRKEIIDELKQNPDLDINVYLSSDWDLEINLQVKNSKEFYNFYNGFIEKYAQYISHKNFYVVNKALLFSHSYLHKKRHSIVMGENQKKVKIDLKEEEILDALEKSPRADLVSLAEKLKMSPSTLNYKIKQLIKKEVIKGCVPVLNKHLLGYNTYRVEVVLNNPAKIKEIVDYLSGKHNVVKIFDLIGNKDMDFYIDAQTTLELDKFLEDLRLNCPYIKEFEVINVLMD